MSTQEHNRLETATATVAALTQAHLEYLKQQQQLIKKLISDHFDQHPHLKNQRDLLTSIPGIGDVTASVLLAEIGDVSDCDNARQLADGAGLTPCERSSGTSVKGKTRRVLYRKRPIAKGVVFACCSGNALQPITQSDE